MLLALSLILMNQQYILNVVSSNRNMHKQGYILIHSLTKMLWQETHRNPLCIFPRSKGSLLFSCLIMSNSFATPWTVVQKAPLSMGFPRKEYWNGFLLQGIFSTLGSNQCLLHCRQILCCWTTREALTKGSLHQCSETSHFITNANNENGLHFPT